WITDHGGKASAVRPVVIDGADRIARTLIGVFRAVRRRPDLRIEVVTCNSEPALTFSVGDRLEAVVVLEIAGGRICHAYGIRNPDKLAAVTAPRVIGR
ncbi:MAG: RNA polymerase subunit sigma-24, partial [Nocardia sp.]|nr:RNA polymerase subunit sigma-24 [Nocardia sp.]